MQRTLTAALLLTALVAVAPSAHAQLSASLVAMIAPPETAFREETPVQTVVGKVDFAADATAFTNVNGIPITYTVSKAPEWAVVVITPSSDVLPFPSHPSHTYVSSRPFAVTIVAAPGHTADAVGEVEITAVTTPSPLGGRATSAKASVPVVYIGSEPCDEGAHAEATEAAAAPIVVEGDATPSSDADGVTTQSAGVMMRPASWVAVVGLGLVGAGVGLVLRRRL